MIWLVIAGGMCLLLALWAAVPTASQFAVPHLGHGTVIGDSQRLDSIFAQLIARLLGKAPKRVGPLVADASLLHPELAGKHGLKPHQSIIVKILSLGSKVLPMPADQAKQLGFRLTYVGIGFSPQEFVGLKIIAMAVFGFGVMALLPDLMRAYGMMLMPLSIVLGFMAPELWLRSRIATRDKAILRLLPEVIDLLSLCMGAGLDFLGALNRVVAVKAGSEKKKEPLLEELSVVMQEIKLGKRRSEALKALAKRVNLQEISSFVRTLVQADRMGTPMKEVLVSHSEDVRFERYNRAEKAALKAPIKILVPLIFCILPCVAIIVGAPVFLQFSKMKVAGQ